MSLREIRDVRVVALLGNDSQHRNTLATLIKNDVNVVGVCIAESKKRGLPLDYIIRSFSRRGFLTTVSQMLARIVYLAVNQRLDRKLEAEIFNDKENCKIITDFSPLIVIDKSFSLQKEFISRLEPEILVVHTGSWVGRDVRGINTVKYVIGGHPGITPFYRGAHSPFWAIFNGDEMKVGWTCFLLDQGVDTGPVLEQGLLIPNHEETYFSLSWRGVKEIALSQVNAIRMFAVKGKINSTAHKFIPENSEYFVPTLSQQIRYWLKQSKVK
ncbi:formyltransferase family protein [uncultured Endozoicomonas sp.]|uniref:formyltransferase family protein n=1 Tax=uncultured Endozoicomonas sp. TaxID=432652 RepID=UPI0026146676|nr:formyltransferase family protein [uncultured Endozoicomonas sp.]